MLFVESCELHRTAAEPERRRVLDALAAAGFAPLVRATRRRMIEQALGAQAHDALAEEMERGLAPRGDGAGPLVPGDLFCFADHVLYLIFRESSVRAGVVHGDGFADGAARLEEFCRVVAEALTAHQVTAAEEWSRPARRAPLAALSLAYARRTATEEESRERAAGAAALEDEESRALLRRLRDVGAGQTPASFGLSQVGGAAVERLVEAGLLRREVRVSCRRTGHALLDLPAADSLALVTASRARCGLCAAPVADEVIEDALNPTELAAALLDGAAWLRDCIAEILNGLGLPPSTLAAGEVSEHGEARLLAEVCGEPFLFFVRDGDLDPEATRRAVAAASDVGAAHLFTVVTGAVEDGARLRLYEFSWRRARDGRDLGVTVLEGLVRARAEIGRALAAAARRKLAREISALDPALGLSVVRLVLGKFRQAPPLTARLAPASDVSLQRWEPAAHDFWSQHTP